MASPGNQHCAANCIGTLSFSIDVYIGVHHKIAVEISGCFRLSRSASGRTANSELFTF